MSEARQERREPRAVPNADNLAHRLANYANAYAVVVTGFTVPHVPDYKAGHVMTAEDARVANWAKLDRASSAGNSTVTRGTMKDESDANKHAWLTKYLNTEYKFTKSLGKEFDRTILETAVETVFRGIAKSQGKNPSDAAVATNVAKLINDASLANKYEAQVRAECERIVAERHEIKSRKGSETRSEDDDNVEV